MRSCPSIPSWAALSALLVIAAAGCGEQEDHDARSAAASGKTSAALTEQPMEPGGPGHTCLCDAPGGCGNRSPSGLFGAVHDDVSLEQTLGSFGVQRSGAAVTGWACAPGRAHTCVCDRAGGCSGISGSSGQIASGVSARDVLRDYGPQRDGNRATGWVCRPEGQYTCVCDQPGGCAQAAGSYGQALEQRSAAQTISTYRAHLDGAAATGWICLERGSYGCACERSGGCYLGQYPYPMLRYPEGAALNGKSARQAISTFGSRRSGARDSGWTCDKEAFPRRIKIVSYNAHAYHGGPGGSSWKDRIDAFASDVARPFRPAIIALQEVYLWSDCIWEGPCGCKAMSWGEHLGYIVNRLRATTQINYTIATNVRTGTSKPCGTTLEMEGEAILYDPAQVNLVPLKPPSNKLGCLERRDGLHSHDYGHRNPYSDCMTVPGNSAQAYLSQAVFEFPRGSNHFFSVFQVHDDRSGCSKIAAAFGFISARQARLHQDLQDYFGSAAHKSGPFKIYPPVFAGDMNSAKYPNCSNQSAVESQIQTRFVNVPHDAHDPPTSHLDTYFGGSDKAYALSSGTQGFTKQRSKGRRRIDKVWVGKNSSIWTRDAGLTVVKPAEMQIDRNDDSYPDGSPSYSPFSQTGYWHGLSMPSSSDYSDHSPALAEVRSTVDIAARLRVQRQARLSGRLKTIGPRYISRFVPPHVQGDRQFAGNGPRVYASVSLSVKNGNEIWATVYMSATETKADWTRAAGSRQQRIYTHYAPIEALVSDTYQSIAYTDTDHADDVLTTSSYTAVESFTCVGDTSGSEAGTKTSVIVRLNPITFREAAPVSTCGDGQVTNGELCDGSDLNGTTCQDLGYYLGALGCQGNCLFDHSTCWGSCGDGQVTNGELCDGSNLGGKTCRTFGYDYGTLRCNGSCRFDFGLCRVACPGC